MGQKKNGGEEIWGVGRTEYNEEGEREMGDDGQALEEGGDPWLVGGAKKAA